MIRSRWVGALALMLLLVVVGVTYADGTDTILNGNFEAGNLSGWSLTGNTEVARESNFTAPGGFAFVNVNGTYGAILSTGPANVAGALFDQLEVDPDARLTAGVASGDSTISLWDAPSGMKLTTLAEHESGVLAIAFDAMSNRIATAGEDGTYRVWTIRADADVTPTLNPQALG